MIVSIDLLSVFYAARQAHAEGRLQFQSKARPSPLDGCLYRAGRADDGKPIGCAIGVGLSDEIAEALDEFAESSIERLLLTGVIQVAGGRDPLAEEALCRLQESHDALLDNFTAAGHAEFLRFLDAQITLWEGKKKAAPEEAAKVTAIGDAGMTP